MIWPMNKDAGRKRQWLPERVRLRGKRTILLDWQMPPDDEAWQAAVDGATGLAGDDIQKGRSRSRMQSLRYLAAMLMVLLGGVAHLWWMGETGAQRIEGEVRAAVEADQWLSRAGDATPAVMTAGAGSVAVERITFKQSVINVEVKSIQTDAQGQPFVVRQQQFYRPTATGWERVPPDAELLGPRQTLTLGQLTFEYHQLDAAAVEAVAAKLDAAYVDLRQDYSLPATSQRIVVELAAGDVSSFAGCFWRARLCIDSPALALLPSSVAESEALHLWTLRALADHVRYEVLLEHPLQFGWQLTGRELTAMQLRRHSERLDAWRRDLARWLYGIEGRTPPPDVDQLTQELAELCMAHQVTAYPSLFARDTGTHLCKVPSTWDLKQLLHTQPPQRLDALQLPDTDLTGAAALTWLQELALGTLLDYVTATYGQDGIVGLIEGFRQYNSWNDLAPAVFGVSAAEFEQGWQAYLQALE